MTNILEVDKLHVRFHTDEGIVRAVRGVSFQVQPGETVGIVGESGCGKSVTSLAIMGLIRQPPGEITAGQIRYRGKDLLQLGSQEMSELRGRKIAMIFQDPMTSLNPFLTIGEQLMEVTERHLRHSRSEARRHAVEMLTRVGIRDPHRRIADYPHQFSGGMRQRVMIAMALSCQPDLLIADEPTTALDVTIQAEIISLLQGLARQFGMAIIFVTHNMGVVAAICQRVLVMYAGRVIEEGPVTEVFRSPSHPYTRGLLASVPRIDQPVGQRMLSIPGQPPDPLRLPDGCPFEPRCPVRVEKCRAVDPELVAIDKPHQVACLVAESTLRNMG